jgi:hypothetical protein
MARRIKRSRLTRTQSKRLNRQTVLLTIASIATFLAIIFLGIPALVRMAVFFGELKSSTEPVGQEDTIAPSKPQLETLPTATVSGQLTIRGFAESDSIIALYRSGSELKETTANDEGEFSFVAVDLRDGENTFYVTAKDSAGNQSDQSPRQTVVYDASPPKLTIDSPGEGETIYGQTNRTINVSGSTDEDSTVTVNDRLAIVNSGNFSTTIQLNEGDNTIVVIATDRAGNETKKEIKVKYQP